MSHGGTDEGIEPDLTPLLDVVMQLLMFFIINVNFVREAVSEEVQLPISTSAIPLVAGETEAIFVNIKSTRNKAFLNSLAEVDRKRLAGAEAVILVPGLPPKTPLDAKGWLRDVYKDLKALKQPKAKVTTIVHLRPDGDLEMNQLFLMMNYCKVAGFTNLKIRAKVRSLE